MFYEIEKQIDKASRMLVEIHIYVISPAIEHTK